MRNLTRQQIIDKKNEITNALDNELEGEMKRLLVNYRVQLETEGLLREREERGKMLRALCEHLFLDENDFQVWDENVEYYNDFHSDFLSTTLEVVILAEVDDEYQDDYKLLNNTKYAFRWY